MLKLLKKLTKTEWLITLLILCFVIVQVFLDLKLPDYMAEITRLVQTNNDSLKDILVQGGYMLLCALGSVISSVIVGFFAARVAASLSRRLRSEIYDKTISFSMKEINKFSTASLITRSTNDVTQVQTLVGIGLRVMLRAPILAIWAIMKISSKNWEWTLVTVAAVVLLLIILTVIIIFALPKFKIIQSLTDNLNRITRENLTGLRVVRAYNAEPYQEDKFSKANKKLTDTNLFTNRIMAIIQPSMTFIMASLTLGIYWIGSNMINQANLPMEKLNLFSNMVVFSSYAMQVIIAFMLLTMIFIILPRVAVSARRIMEVLETSSEIKDGSLVGENTSEKGEIEFRNVSFKYYEGADNVIENISFKANRGESIAIIGATGSGKTTLVNLIPRFYDVTEGEILIDGINVKDYKQEELYNKIGYVSQKAILFSGTIKDNVNYGENGKVPATDEMIKKSIEIAQASEIVKEKEEGLDSHIAQGGSNLSGGQKQRLSIARAICKQPEIYIFDDSFSALDYKTDRSLRKALNEETSNATSIIVAQRIGTIKDSDKIIVLEKGQIVGIGKHRELLNNCSVYKEIALSQLSEEELNNE